MLKMFEGIPDLFSLKINNDRVSAYQMKLSRGEEPTAKENREMRDHLLGIGRGEFKDDKHRDQMLDLWWKGSKRLAKKFIDEKKNQP